MYYISPVENLLDVISYQYILIAQTKFNIQLKIGMTVLLTIRRGLAVLNYLIKPCIIYMINIPLYQYIEIKPCV